MDLSSPQSICRQAEVVVSVPWPHDEDDVRRMDRQTRFISFTARESYEDTSNVIIL